MQASTAATRIEVRRLPCAGLSTDAKSKAASDTAYFAVYALALAVAVVPLLLARFPYMMDYTGHLARCSILAQFHADPLWHRFYRVELGPIPNLAMDAIVVPLAHFLPVETSGKIFLVLLAVLYVCGCDALGRAAWGHRHWMALAAGCTFFNSNLRDGRVNYLFGLALFLWVFAFWLRRRRQMTPAWFALFSILSALVYLAHLGAAAVLGVACATVALTDFFHQRRADTNPGAWFGQLFTQTGWMLCPVFLLIFGFLRRNGRIGHIAWGSWVIKASHLLTLFRTYDLHLEAVLFAGLMLSASVLAWRARWHRGLATAGLVLFGCYLATPMRLFTSDYADARFVLPAFVLWMIAIRPQSRRPQAAALALCVALLLFHAVHVGRGWMSSEPGTRQFLALGDGLAPGARVDVIDSTAGKSGGPGFRRLALSHLADTWSITRHVYLSNVFAIAGQQPLVQDPKLVTCMPRPGGDCLRHFDYALTDGPSAQVLARLREVATPFRRWNSFTLWAIRR